MMNKRILFAFTAGAAVVTLGSVATYLASAAPHNAVQTVRAISPAPALPASVDAPAVVDAANAFLATLSEKQRPVAQIDLTAGNAARWSNFPAGSAQCEL
jgi:hypothetical protein